MKKLLIATAIIALTVACKEEKKQEVANINTATDSIPTTKVAKPFVWEGANIYFLLTDRFNNGNPDNDISFERNEETGELRGFMGGDIQGITKKIED